MAKYGPSELTRDDLLELDDSGYAPENVVIVTGGGAGIGRATSLAFAANGLTVVATDRDEEGLASVKQEAAELDLPGTIETVTGNLANDNDLQRIVDEAAEHGSIRYLINNSS
jgi:3-hydroxybutyrate dehydrogenase